MSAQDLQDESTAELEKSIAEIDAINMKIRDNLNKEHAEEEAKTYRQDYGIDQTISWQEKTVAIADL
ncbi:MAG: hypothetical protein ACLSTI_07075 [Ruminococcus sp.]